MYYNLYVYQIFTQPSVYSIDMENNAELVKSSPVYENNKEAIDDYIARDKVYADMFKNLGQVKKVANEDRTEQIVHIQCLRDSASAFLDHPDMPKFLEMRTTVGFDILKCWSIDAVFLTEEPSEMIGSFDEGLAKFNS